MAWMVLFLASLSEVGWTVGMKYSAGFTRLGPSIWTLFNMVLSLVLLAQAVKSLPLGTAYAVWTGIGAAGTAVLGMLLFGESSSWPRLASIGLIVAGVIGLKLVTAE